MAFLNRSVNMIIIIRKVGRCMGVKDLPQFNSIQFCYAWTLHMYAVVKLATCDGLGLGPECAHSMKQPNNKEVRSLYVGLIGKANSRLLGLFVTVRDPKCD